MKERKANKTILLTFDYELFLNESGSLENCLIKPTERLRSTLNKHNVKATFFIDILYYLRLNQDSRFEEEALKVKNQIQDLLKDGHDIELHLHPQWLEAVYQNEQWIFPDLKIYSLQQLHEDKITELFKIGIELLEDICKPVDTNYTVTAFRAGGLCITPFDKLKSSFKRFNILVDSSVAKGLQAQSKYQNYNFLDAPNSDIYRFDDNPLIKDDTGKFVEIPISVFSINLIDKIKSKFYRLNNDFNNLSYSGGEGKSLSPSKKVSENVISKIFKKLFSYKMPFSLDYVQPGLIIDKVKQSKRGVLTFLSHNKFISQASLLTLEKLVSNGYKFSTFQQFSNRDFKSVNKSLILITGHFPYVVDEGYLKEEIFLLSKEFKKIIIVTQDTFSKEAHALPSNCKVFRVNSILSKPELLYSSFLSFFNKEIYSEIYEIFKTYKRVPNRRLFIDLITLIYSGKKIFSFINDIIKKENLQSKDIVVYSYWLDKCAYAATKLTLAGKVKAGISRAHSYDIYLWRNQNSYLPIRRFLYNNLSCIYFISAHGKKYFEDLLNIKNSSKLRLNKLGVSNNQYQIKSNYHKETTEYFNILSCSYIMPIKRIKEIIESLAEIDNVKLNWVHIGDGTQAEEYADNVIKLSENLLAKKSNIKYQFKGKILYDELLNYYSNNNVDVFINVSVTEGLPVSIMEAMSFGVPVIATSVGGTPEIVDKSNGVLLSENPSIDEIANAIIKMCNLSDSEYKIYRENAYNTWKEEYNSEKNYMKFVKEISDLL